MSIDWKYEKFRRLYTAEEGTFANLPFEARILAAYLLKFVDRHGRIYVRPDKVLANELCIRMRASKASRRWVAKAVDSLLTDGYLTAAPGVVAIRNFTAAHRTGAAEALVGRSTGADTRVKSPISLVPKPQTAAPTSQRSEDPDPEGLSAHGDNGAGPGADRPCAFHAAARNSGRRAPRDVVRTTCGECRHMNARARPKAASEPQMFSEVLMGLAAKVRDGGQR